MEAGFSFGKKKNGRKCKSNKLERVCKKAADLLNKAVKNGQYQTGLSETDSIKQGRWDPFGSRLPLKLYQRS